MADDLPGFPGSLAELLLERRTVLISGPIDEVRAGQTAASLMALDALGDDPIEIRVNGSCDSLDAGFTLIDTIDTLGVFINATVVGAASGTLVGVVAVCCRRTMGASGRLHLREPTDRYHGTATDIERQAGSLGRRFDAYLHRLAEATGRPFEHLEADHRIGAVLDARQARAYGLIDDIAGPRAT